jgi:ribonuclease HI
VQAAVFQAAIQRTIAMPADRPHFLLFAEGSNAPSQDRQWRFVLQPIDGGDRISADDVEAQVSGDRLELLAALRGLEALEQPSRVTLLTRSRYVRRGISHDLAQWRDSGWRWERFGRLVPIRDHDLWQRLDRALAIHEVACWPWPKDGRVPIATEMDESAVTTYGIGCAGAIEPSFEPTLVIVERKRPATRNVLRRVDKQTRRRFATLNQETADRWSKAVRPELSRTA